MREFKERDNYVIKVDGELIKVSREVYETYHRMERRERYLVERDQDNSLIFFSTCVQQSWTTLTGVSPVTVIASEPCS